MSETLTITLSEKRMAYFREYAGTLGQPPEKVASHLFALLLDDIKNDDDGNSWRRVVPVEKRGIVR